MLQSHWIAKIKASFYPGPTWFVMVSKWLWSCQVRKPLLYSLVIDGSGTRSSLIHFACIGVAPSTCHASEWHRLDSACHVILKTWQVTSNSWYVCLGALSSPTADNSRLVDVARAHLSTQVLPNPRERRFCAVKYYKHIKQFPMISCLRIFNLQITFSPLFPWKVW